MLSYHEHFDPNITAWEYCKSRYDQAVLKHVSTNTNYIGTYSSYINWFENYNRDILMVDDENVHENETENETVLGTGVSKNGTVYITQYNVEVFFRAVVVPTCTGAPCTVRKIVSALNWFLEFVENRTTRTNKCILLVYSPAIVECIAEQRVNALAHSAEAKAGTDPHRGVKDIFSEDEVISIVHSMWTLRADSEDLLFSYTWGKNAGVRGASSRVMTFCDLNLSTGFGPDRCPPNDKTLMLIHRGGKRHKNNFSTCKQVGAQRHRDWRQCAVFCTGVLVIQKLRNLGTRINFFKSQHKNGRAEWWDIPLNSYANYSQESSAMRQVLTAAGLDVYGGKVTHHRTQMVQTAGSRGLQPWQVCTMTKHITDKYHSAYLPEVEEEAMKVMSGFRKSESRFVPTEHVVFPGNHQTYLEDGINYLIPHYSRLVQEQQSTLGDKTQCANKILYQVIPYLVETVLQVGYYFIHEYPQHPLTFVLQDIPGYANDSVRIIHNVVAFANTRTEDQVATVHHTVATVLSSVREEVHSIDTKVARYQGHMNMHERQFRQECSALRTGLDKVVSRQDTILSEIKILQQQNQEIMLLMMQQLQLAPPLAAAVAPTQQSIVDEPSLEVALAVGVGGVARGRIEVVAENVVEASHATTATRFAKKQGLDASSALNPSNMPRIPRLKKKFLVSWNDLVSEWKLLDLQSFHGSKTTLWEPADRQRYSKRLRAMQQLHKFKKRVEIDDDFKMAEKLDSERDNRKLTLTTHYDFLVKNDTTILRRKRKPEETI